MYLTKEQSHTIGFVVTCLFHEAIDVNELNRWADHVITSEEDYPLYIVDLSVFNTYPKDIFKVIGFTPDLTLTRDQKKAMTGIAHLRGMASPYAQFSRDTALKALETHPEILDEFKRTFPFIASDEKFG
jgi:hypothetical protein